MLVHSSPAAVRMFIDAPVYDALPDVIQKDVDALSKDYDELTMELIRELAKGVSEGDPVAVAGRIHLSVVLAPVYAQVSRFFETCDRTFKPVDALYEMWSMLHEYWDTSTEELLLDCEQRRNLARGVSFRHLLKPIERLTPSARFDVLYQYIGRYFDTVDSEIMGEMVEDKCHLGLMVQSLNGDPSMISYGHEHRMSFLTDSQLEAFVAEVGEVVGNPELTNEEGMGDSGVYLTLEYWNYMEMRSKRAGYKDSEEYPAWKLACLLHSEHEMSHFGVVTMLTEYDHGTVAKLIDTCKDFNNYERQVVAAALSDLTDQHSAVDLQVIENMTVLAADLAPLIGKFYAAGYEDVQDSLWRSLDDAYGAWDTDVDMEIAFGKTLHSYSCWNGPGTELEGEDLRWAGRHALELADHAALLMEIGPRGRAEYEQMLERPALASGVL